MTPRSAKILAHTLAATIKRFEEENSASAKTAETSSK
jgi:hypothetical protein